MLIGSVLLYSLPAALLAKIPSALTLAIATIACTFGVLVERRSLRCDQGMFCNPANIMLLSIFVHYLLGCLLLAIWHTLPWTNQLWLDWYARFDIENGLALSTIICLFGVVGTVIGTFLSSFPGSPMTVFSSPISTRVPILSVSVFAALVQVVIAPLVDTTYRQYFSAIGSLSWLGTALIGYNCALTIDNKRQLSGWMLCGAPVIGILSFGMLNDGMREPVLKAFLFFGVGFVASGARIPRRPLTAAVVALLIILPVLNASKEVIRANKQSREEGLQTVAAAMQAQADQGIASGLETGLASITIRSNLAIFPLIYSSYYPSTYPYLDGQTFFLTLYNAIPRFMWHNKPFIGLLLNEYARGVGIVNLDDNEASAVFDAFSEYYINFGLLGVLIGSSLQMVYYALIAKLVSRALSPRLGLVVVSVLLVSNHDFFSVFNTFTSEIRILPVWLFCCLALRWR